MNIEHFNAYRNTEEMCGICQIYLLACKLHCLERPTTANVQRTEHGKNSFSSVFPFSNAQSLSAQQTKRVTFIFKFGSSLPFVFFLSNELTASSRLRLLKPLQFWCQVLEKLQLSTEAQILPMRRWHQQQRQGAEDSGHCSSSWLAHWLCSSCCKVWAPCRWASSYWFFGGQREKLGMPTLQRVYMPLSTEPFSLLMSKLHPKQL